MTTILVAGAIFLWLAITFILLALVVAHADVVTELDPHE